MRIQRFDFYSLDDFRHPLPPSDETVDETVESEPEEAPPPPVFSQDELEAAKQQVHAQGFIEGKKAGLEEAKTESAKRQACIEILLGQMTQQIDTLYAQHRTYVEEQSRQISRIVLSIVRKMAGDIIQTAPTKPVEQLVEECLGIIMHQPKATLTVHPDLRDDLDGRVREFLNAQGMDGTFTIEADESLDIPNARLEWKHGSADYSLEVLWKQIEEKLQAIDFADALHHYFEAPDADKMDEETPSEEADILSPAEESSAADADETALSTEKENSEIPTTMESDKVPEADIPDSAAS